MYLNNINYNFIIVLKGIFSILLIILLFLEWKKEYKFRTGRITYEERKSGISIALLIFFSMISAPVTIYCLIVQLIFLFIYIAIFFIFVLRKENSNKNLNKKLIFRTNKGYLLFYIVIPMISYIISYTVGMCISLKYQCIPIVFFVYQVILNVILLSLILYLIFTIAKWLFLTFKYKFIDKIKKDEREEIKPISTVLFMFPILFVLMLM